MRPSKPVDQPSDRSTEQLTRPQRTVQSENASTSAKTLRQPLPRLSNDREFEMKTQSSPVCNAGLIGFTERRCISLVAETEIPHHANIQIGMDVSFSTLS
jgi:hypothetical protein